ncbi:HD-GYP domain-containing protein [Anaeromicropila herbilytica]|uniref:Phosphohydrolase n=1 Tax=Anaeromicropila herbilytica TaxID=2785025 RepID=A0A7R7EMD5_9FIRM|nr:HD-GYP domain-containing protein [Anaeromicropila herbilytica]BCN31276.1 phosphohydrolase [Anaeromicropila herbilytica]
MDTKEEWYNKQEYVDYHDVIECIASALDAKDPYTANHSSRVSDMAQKVAILMDLEECDIQEIRIAAHLHDIGKIGIPDAILNKKSKLNKEEWDKLREHPRIGAKILRKSSRFQSISDIVLHHHERYDGKGYPDGICGNDISLGARIVMICDSIDAMLNNRCYRKAFTENYCYQEIRENLGKMYDPLIGQYVLEHWNDIVNMENFVNDLIG